MREWVDKISRPFDTRNTKEKHLKELEEFVQDRIKYISENEECDEVELGSICEINLGARIVKNKCSNGNIPVYGGGDISFYTDISNRNKNTLIVSRYAMSKECVRLITKDFYLNDSGLSVSSKDLKLQSYINYNLLSKYYQEFIYTECTQGTIQKNINMNNFLKLKIKIPKNKKLISDLEKTFSQIEKLQEEIKEADTLYKQYIQELAEEALPSTSEKSVKTIDLSQTEPLEKTKKKSSKECVNTTELPQSEPKKKKEVAAKTLEEKDEPVILPKPKKKVVLKKVAKLEKTIE
jgi:hypothetical protein